ncbi:MAG: hypothetical protein WBP64_05955 [Nitrososphaeraceae archaeon]|jgi:hypothetical protein
MFQDEKIDGHIISNDIAAVVGIVNFDVGQAQQSTQNEELKCAILIIQNSTSLIQLNQRYAVLI